MKSWLRPIKKMGVCQEALDWGEQFDSLAEAWEKCERGDWMLWLEEKLCGSPETGERKRLVIVACQCARLALPYVREGELRPLRAIETAEAWARGEEGIDFEMVRDAAIAADVAYAIAAAAADAAANAAAAAAADDARYETLKECAEIVRKFYKDPIIPVVREEK